jgi:hypothetical protein
VEDRPQHPNPSQVKKMSVLEWGAWIWPSEKNPAKPVALIDRMLEALVLAVDQTRVILGPLLGY